MTQEDIHGTPKSTINGADGWSEKAIAGRGILVDFELWTREHKVEYSALTSYAVTVPEIEAIFREKSIVPRPGDVLLLRTG